MQSISNRRGLLRGKSKSFLTFYLKFFGIALHLPSSYSNIPFYAELVCTLVEYYFLKELSTCFII